LNSRGSSGDAHIDKHIYILKKGINQSMNFLMDFSGTCSCRLPL